MSNTRLYYTRTEERREVYRKGRERLISEMGGRCTACGSTRNLEMHHPNSRDWEPRRTARWVRLARYRREWAERAIVLLCRSCNARAG